MTTSLLDLYPPRVYVVRGLVSGLLKIGTTRYVDQRLPDLASQWEPLELLALIPGDALLEREMHRHFAASLAGIRGREWFRDDGTITDFVDSLPASMRSGRTFKVEGREVHHRGMPRGRKASAGTRAHWAAYEREHGHRPAPQYSPTCRLCIAEQRVVIRLNRLATKARSAILDALAGAA